MQNLRFGYIVRLETCLSGNSTSILESTARFATDWPVLPSHQDGFSRYVILLCPSTLNYELIDVSLIRVSFFLLTEAMIWNYFPLGSQPFTSGL